MIYFLKKYKKLLILISFPYLYILILLTLPTPFHGTAPGGLQNVASTFVVENVELNTNFHTIFVISYHPLTPFQRFLLESNDKTDVRPVSIRQQDTTLRDQHLEGQISKLVSYKQSLINAYQMAAMVDDSITISYQYEGLLVRYRPKHFRDLSVGDLIIKINGESALDYTHDDFLLLAYENEVTFTVRKIKNGETTEFEVNYTYNETDLQMLFYPSYTITNASPTFEMPGLDSFIGGPSGGLMQTMALYTSLLNIDLGNLIIAGTGTMEIDGRVGRIGAVTQKLFTAERLGVNVFFMPEAHRNDVIDFPFSFELIFVDSVIDLIEKLGELS